MRHKHQRVKSYQGKLLALPVLKLQGKQFHGRSPGNLLGDVRERPEGFRELGFEPNLWTFRLSRSKPSCTELTRA